MMSSPTTTKRTSSKWLAPRVTNYGILSFEEKIEGVVISGLQQSVMCPFRNSNMGDICEFLGEIYGESGESA